MKPLFALLTDFGLTDPYVAQMKAVLLYYCPTGNILDISHDVGTQNILQAGFFLASSWNYLPTGSICLTVVDPGVGTSRRILLVQNRDKYLFVPDNGLISLLLENLKEYRIWSLYRPWQGISSTFHGRDIFAPAAAQLARGADLSELGTEIALDETAKIAPCTPVQTGSRVWSTIVHIDQFGNCFLNLDIRKWASHINRAVSIGIPGLRKEVPLKTVSAYADLQGTDIGILESSQGVFEIAVNQDSCSRRFDLETGQQVGIVLGDLD